MTSYILRRLLLVIPTLFGITAVVFFVMALSPGGTGISLLTREGDMKPSERKALQEYYERRYGLNKPLVVQYFRWVNKVSPVGVKDAGVGFPASWKVGLKVPDLGESFARRRPVIGLIAEALPITILLNAVSFPFIYSLSILSGIQAAKRKGQLFDVASGTIFLGLWSVPGILAGVLMIGFLANKEYLHLFPTAGLHDPLSETMPFLPAFGADGFQRGWLLDTLWHLVLPIVCMTYGSFAFLSKLSRGTVLENIASDYVRTARAKGVAEKDILYRHVFRNSLIPLITVCAHILPALISGAVIIESIFNIDGMGKLMIDAVNSRDRELVLSDALVAGLLGLLSYLLADILYAVADPRVSYE